MFACRLDRARRLVSSLATAADPARARQIAHRHDARRCSRSLPAPTGFITAWLTSSLSSSATVSVSTDAEEVEHVLRVEADLQRRARVVLDQEHFLAPRRTRGCST